MDQEGRAEIKLRCINDDSLNVLSVFPLLPMNRTIHVDIAVEVQLEANETLGKKNVSPRQCTIILDTNYRRVFRRANVSLML